MPRETAVPGLIRQLLEAGWSRAAIGRAVQRDSSYISQAAAGRKGYNLEGHCVP